ncbi:MULTISPECIES: class I SAM-dependent methyltransferase [Planktothrix]|uniref:class I SAM-dependent methyltransferase n=2 Tax=Planktothrix TaxID=54304 RepID=UPI000688686C|nr:class I SAM-dependent methyltransferase [Planktothrix mougeotii]
MIRLISRCQLSLKLLMNPQLYQGAAEYYARHRTKYPSSLFEKLDQLFKLNGRGRLLDLGCGPGIIAIPMSDRFEEVVAIDPDPEMVKVCQQEAQSCGIHNILSLQKKAEDIDTTWGQFKLATIGRAFHWMDREAVLQRSYDRLSTDGGIAIISTDEDPWRSDLPLEKATIKVVKKWLGESRKTGTQGLPDIPHEDLVERSSFPDYAVYKLKFEQLWTIPNYIGYLYSTAFCLQSFLQNNIENFERELTETLLKIEPSGQFNQTITISLIVAGKTHGMFDSSRST